MANSKCKECGCVCNKCATSQDVHLHVEIENLKQRLVERENHIVTMETTFLNEADKYPNGEYFALREEILTWQDKYSRLYEAHKRVQKVNQSLEDKLLKLVDKTETEKNALTKDVATLSHRLADANYNIQRLQEDNEKYKNDVNLAIQLLQCKPANFVSHRVDSLPNEVQAKVTSYVASRRKPDDKKVSSEVRSIKVPIPTFPPTAMVYSIPKTPSPDKDNTNGNEPEKLQVDIVSAAIMAKILEERERERSFTKHCNTCTCSKINLPTYITISHQSVTTQTGNQKSSVCLRCSGSGSLQQSPLTGMKLVKSAEHIIVPNDENMKTYPQNRMLLHERSKHNLSKAKSAEHVSESKPMQLSSQDSKASHHRLCDQIITHNTKNENVKGPRYCSMRVQTGTNNILLDNIHNNYEPVLYTRQNSNEKKQKSSDKLSNNYGSSRTGSNSTSSDEHNVKSLSLSESDNSYQKHQHQRVAEWVQNIDEIEVSVTEVPEISDVENVVEINKNLANVNNKSAKKISLGHQKYQSVPQNDGSMIEMNRNGNSHTETEI